MCQKMDRTPVVDGRGVTVNEDFTAAYSMKGLMDQSSAQSVMSRFGVETIRPTIFYTNDAQAQQLAPGDRLHCDDRKYTCKTKPVVQNAIPPTHYEIVCEEIER